MAIILDGVVLSAPVIGDGITGDSLQISGAFTEGEARKLAAALNGE